MSTSVRKRSPVLHALLWIGAVVAVTVTAWVFWPTVVTPQLREGERPEVDESDAVTQVEAVAVQRADFPILAEATGYLAPWRQVEISAEVAGRVAERLAQEGRRVEAGAPLVRLDDVDRRLELAEAEAAVLAARGEFAVYLSADAGRAVAADTSRLAIERQAYLAAQEAFDTGTITEAELNAAMRRFEAARVLSGEQRESVQAVRVGLVTAEQRLERARLALERTVITAPFAGRLADVEVEMGQQVSTGQKLLHLIDDAQMKVEVDVLEADMVHMREGVEARVRIPALGDAAVAGRVHTVNPRINAGTGTGRVTVAVPNPRGELIAGLYATVHVEARILPDRLIVPGEALLVRQGRDLVFRIEDGRAKWVYVTVGARSGDFVEIVDGVDEGDLLATANHFAIAHDAPVVVR